MTDPQLVTFNNWTFQWQSNHERTGRLLILLHGWTGDENSMWILARHLSSKYSILAPRAPYSAPEGGYSWRKIELGSWGLPSFNDLRLTAEALLVLVDAWSTSVGMEPRQFDVIGFSQGAAMAYSVAMLHPDRVRKLAALSGFLPEGAEEILAEGLLSEKKVFISHGREDDMIPVERARTCVTLLKESGVHVTYCESDSGHKVSKDCLQAMESYFGGN